MKPNYSTRLIDLTLGEFLDAIETRVKTILNATQQEELKPTRYVYGLKGLMNLLGCSKTTASRLKSSGKIDEAITQVGALIIIDADKALKLAGKQTTKKQ